MKNYHISLFRHGRTDANDRGQYIGTTDFPLNDRGRSELIDKTDRYVYPKVQRVYTSPLQRCTESAEILFPDREIVVAEDFRELHFGKFEGKTADEIINICNKKSGVLGLSGNVSSDFRDLAMAAADGNETAKDALEAYAYRVGKYIGAYAAAMNGVDAIVFTAGAGENNAEVRALIGQYIGFLGTNIDAEKNKIRGEEVILSDADAKVTTMVIQEH